MSRSISVPVLLITCIVFMAGCHFSLSAGLGKKRTSTSTTQSEPTSPPPETVRTADARPPIRGEWSEPVNGIRMMVREVVPEIKQSEPRESITLILFAWNTTQQSVSFPYITPERYVHVKPLEGQQQERTRTSRNLRIMAEPLGLRQAVHIFDEQLEEMMMANAKLQPGEVRLHAVEIHIILEQEEKLQKMMAIRQDTIPSSEVRWYSPHGEYRLHLTYRPDGFQTGDWEGNGPIDRIDGWQDKQIDLPPIVVRVSDPGELYEQ